MYPRIVDMYLTNRYLAPKYGDRYFEVLHYYKYMYPRIGDTDLTDKYLVPKYGDVYLKYLIIFKYMYPIRFVQKLFLVGDLTQKPYY